MPTGAHSLIVGGGLGTTLPNTPGTLPVFLGPPPITLTDSTAKQSANAKSVSWGDGAAFGATADDQVIIGRGSVGPLDADGSVYLGSDITGGQPAAGFPPNVGIGRKISFSASTSGSIIINASSATVTQGVGNRGIALLTNYTGGDPGHRSVVIADNPTLTTGMTRNVMIGAGVDASGGSVGDNVVIGADSSGGPTANHVTIIGSNASAGSVAAPGAIIVGYASFMQAGGAGGIVIGTSSVNRHVGCILIGSGITDTGYGNNTCLIGGQDGPVMTLVIGGGGEMAGILGGTTIRLTDRTGAGNLDGDNLTIRAGGGTGTGTNGSKVEIQSPINAAAGVKQAFATRLRVHGQGIVDIRECDVDGIASFRLFAKALAGGNPLISFNNVVNQAGALAGSLGNSPVAGDPKWMLIDVDGVPSYMPYWN